MIEDEELAFLEWLAWTAVAVTIFTCSWISPHGTHILFLALVPYHGCKHSGHTGSAPATD